LAGLRIPGRAIEARTASWIGPDCSQISRPVAISDDGVFPRVALGRLGDAQPLQEGHDLAAVDKPAARQSDIRQADDLAPGRRLRPLPQPAELAGDIGRTDQRADRRAAGNVRFDASLNQRIDDADIFLIERFASDAGKKAGEFFTPRKVSEVVAKLAHPRSGDRICDPACGSGSLLLRAGEEVGDGNFQLFGQESNGHGPFIAQAMRHQEIHWQFCRLANGVVRFGLSLRYAERVDWRDYEKRIRQLLDRHVVARDVINLVEPLNIFDDIAIENRRTEKAESDASIADTIAHQLTRSIEEKWDEDPIFFEKFSKLVRDTIADFHKGRISDLAYLSKIRGLREKVQHRQDEADPTPIRLPSGSRNRMA
jgi:hypothetical protein